MPFDVVLRNCGEGFNVSLRQTSVLELNETVFISENSFEFEFHVRKPIQVPTENLTMELQVQALPLRVSRGSVMSVQVESTSVRVDRKSVIRVNRDSSLVKRNNKNL